VSRKPELAVSTPFLSVLAMACQPAVQISFLFFMAFNTNPHPPYFLRQTLLVLHLAMTLPANNLAVDVALVVEKHMFRNIIDFHPGRRFLIVEIFMFFLNPRMFDDNVVVAVQAFFHRRQSRMIGVCHIWVAILALNLFDAAVDIVTEGDRLLRTGPGCRCGVEKQ
jgi:hypothetical protein